MVVKMYEYMDGEGLPLAATVCASTLSSGDTPQRPASLLQPGTSRRTPHNRGHRRPPLTEKCQAIVKTAPTAGPQPSWRPPEALG